MSEEEFALMADENMPEEVRRFLGDEFVDCLSDNYPFVVVVGFKEEPDSSFSRELERLGGVELLVTESSTGGTVKRMPRWQYWPWRLLWKLGIKLDWPRARADS